jgi:hypothetical protein
MGSPSFVPRPGKRQPPKACHGRHKLVKDRLSSLPRKNSKEPAQIPGTQAERVEFKWKPQTIRDISYPPAHHCTKPQRANREGRPKFYCATYRPTLFYEIHSHVGDLITISHWRTVAPLTVNPVGYSPDVFARLGPKRDCPPYAHADFHVDERQRLIREFFCEEFTRNVPEGQDDLYRLTAAIAEKHLGGPIDAVMYPAMAQWANADNFAIEPKFVDFHVQFLYATSVRIGKEDASTFEVSEVDFAKADGVGKLHWTGRPMQWPLKGQGDVLILKEEAGS